MPNLRILAPALRRPARECDFEGLNFKQRFLYQRAASSLLSLSSFQIVLLEPQSRHSHLLRHRSIPYPGQPLRIFTHDLILSISLDFHFECDPTSDDGTFADSETTPQRDRRTLITFLESQPSLFRRSRVRCRPPRVAFHSTRASRPFALCRRPLSRPYHPPSYISSEAAEFPLLDGLRPLRGEPRDLFEYIWLS